MATATTDRVWSAQDTHPDEIEAAVRNLVNEAHADDTSHVPARVLNLVVIVDDQWRGEIDNRLRHVGRYQPSRTVVCSVEARRRTLDAVVTVAAPEVARGELALTRESVVVDVGHHHLRHLDTVVDPLVVTDLPTMLWAPHGHLDGIWSLLRLAQIVLLDSVDEPDPAEALQHACELTSDVYVVDLAWLRSTPWRERLAATFDPPHLRGELGTISSVCVRHHPASGAAALLLLGWLASRLGWQLSPLVGRGGAAWVGKAHGRRQDVQLRTEVAPELQVRGLAGVTLETAGGRHLRFDRGPGGLRATYRNRKGQERSWTVVGASRGEGGILGEGIRQALLRDPTYRPALEAARTLVG